MNHALDKAKKRSESKAASEIHYPYKRLRKDVDSERQGIFCCFCREEDIEFNLHAAGTMHASISKKKYCVCKDYYKRMERNGNNDRRRSFDKNSLKW